MLSIGRLRGSGGFAVVLEHRCAARMQIAQIIIDNRKVVHDGSLFWRKSRFLHRRILSEQDAMAVDCRGVYFSHAIHRVGQRGTLRPPVGQFVVQGIDFADAEITMCAPDLERWQVVPAKRSPPGRRSA